MKLITENHDGTTYQIIQTDKFKTRLLSVWFFSDYHDETATTRNLMISMMKAQNKTYPTRKLQSMHLESLYDALWVAQAQKFGTRHVNRFTMIIIDDKYTMEKTLFEESLDFIHQALFKPSFDEASLALEKQFLKDYFKAEYANKNRFAAKRYSENLMADHPYRGSAQGTIERIDNITLDMIWESYHDMMNNNQVFVSVIGDLGDKDINQKIQKHLPFRSKVSHDPFIYRHSFTKKPTIIEPHAMRQMRFFMTLKTDIFYRDDDYFAMVLLNTMLGEGSDSLLFKSIREEAGLVYDISSSYSPYTGIITLQCGINPNNLGKAIKRIDQSLSSLRDNLFTDEDLMLAKTTLISGFKQSFDSPGSIVQKALRSALFNIPFHERKLLDTISDLSRESIVGIAKKLQPIFQFEFGGERDATKT